VRVARTHPFLIKGQGLEETACACSTHPPVFLHIRLAICHPYINPISQMLSSPFPTHKSPLPHLSCPLLPRPQIRPLPLTISLTHHSRHFHAHKSSPRIIRVTFSPIYQSPFNIPCLLFACKFALSSLIKLSIFPPTNYAPTVLPPLHIMIDISLPINHPSRTPLSHIILDISLA
jgi:hypothetical protein